MKEEERVSTSSAGRILHHHDDTVLHHPVRLRIPKGKKASNAQKTRREGKKVVESQNEKRSREGSSSQIRRIQETLKGFSLKLKYHHY